MLLGAPENSNAPVESTLLTVRGSGSVRIHLGIVVGLTEVGGLHMGSEPFYILLISVFHSHNIFYLIIWQEILVKVYEYMYI